MKKIYYWLMLLVLLPFGIFAQSSTIKGRVINATNGTPLPGVSITVNTTSGQRPATTTNENGEYSIVDPGGATSLVFTFTGMESKTEAIKGRNTINVQMASTSQELEQVIVVGYGTQKRANATGAVDQISSKNLENRPMTNLSQGLQGLLPNLNLKMGDGKPTQSPSYNIRGTTSIGQGGSALILIDGFEGDPSLINPNDIETVSILKDAASAAIYGARGVFGVVLIQ